MSMKRKPKPGERVAHRRLNDNDGAARSGVAVDVVGDKKQSLVIVESEEGREAFDTREMVTLGPAEGTAGPVVLRPSHLKAALRRRQSILALLFEFVLIGALVFSGLAFGLSLKTMVVLAVAIMIVGTGVVILLEREAQRELRKPEPR